METPKPKKTPKALLKAEPEKPKWFPRASCGVPRCKWKYRMDHDHIPGSESDRKREAIDNAIAWGLTHITFQAYLPNGQTKYEQIEFKTGAVNIATTKTGDPAPF